MLPWQNKSLSSYLEYCNIIFLPRRARCALCDLNPLNINKQRGQRVQREEDLSILLQDSLYYRVLALLVIILCSGCAFKALYREDNMTNFENERQHLVYDIVAKSVHNPLVLKALNEVPRHLFIPKELRAQSYKNHPVEIGYGQTISQPLIVAMMTDALNIKPDHKILEIGTGSGYQAAVLSKLAREVYSIEIVEELAEHTQELLKNLGFDNIQTKIGDGSNGWQEHAPYDGIIVTAASRELPPAFLSQLKEGGVLVIPIGREDQHLKIFEKKNGFFQEKDLGAVRFVPMTGEVLKAKA